MNVEPIDILLVEDNPFDAELTLRALKRLNLVNRVLHAKDGAAALEHLLGPAVGPPRIEMPKVVLLDLKLPLLDGLEVLRQVRACDRTKMTPVVVLTSSQEDRDIVESYSLGVNSYIVKPVESEKFVAAVSDLGMYWLLLNRPPW